MPVDSDTTICKEPRPQMCTMEYNPVCGWYNESINCFAYPCAGEYGNACSACGDSKVSRVTKGPCPKVGSTPQPEPVSTKPIITRPVITRPVLQNKPEFLTVNKP